MNHFEANRINGHDTICLGLFRVERLMDQKIRARLTDFADRLKGPLGPIPLDRAIKADLSLFGALRASGSTWVQIANALAAAGARRPAGGLISPDHLRSAVSRQLKRTESTSADSASTQQESRLAPTPAPSINTTKRLDNHAVKPRVASAIPTPNQAARTLRKAVSTRPNKPTEKGRPSVLEKLARTRQLRET